MHLLPPGGQVGAEERLEGKAADFILTPHPFLLRQGLGFPLCGLWVSSPLLLPRAETSEAGEWVQRGCLSGEQEASKGKGKQWSEEERIQGSHSCGEGCKG